MPRVSESAVVIEVRQAVIYKRIFRKLTRHSKGEDAG
jgi:hypothetical protein